MRLNRLRRKRSRNTDEGLIHPHSELIQDCALHEGPGRSEWPPLSANSDRTPCVLEIPRQRSIAVLRAMETGIDRPHHVREISGGSSQLHLRLSPTEEPENRSPRSGSNPPARRWRVRQPR